MAAPETHPFEYVIAIRRLLENYERGFAFIKELIQNADDALRDSPQPGNLHLQWYKPTEDDGFENPLLCGPSLLVINDGPFTKKDRDALMRMGLGSKAGDSERIGRFGLGMKAAFHVSESFFFLESGGNQELRELFCPWLPPQYESWAIKDDHYDWDRMTTVIRTFVPHFENWFAVWIPLRRRDLVTNGIPIVPDYPGDSVDCPESLTKSINHQTPSLGEALIFLRNLERVSFHDGVRCQHFFHRRNERQVSPNTTYYRHQSDDNRNLVIDWQAKPAWPKVFEITETGERSVADKAKWEASVAISASRQPGIGSLRIFWTVFLPVGNKPAFEAPIPSLERNLSLFLHGYLFLNEDRTQVYGANDGFKSASETDPKGIKIAWNKALATSPSGLLQLIPTALESAFIGEGFRDHQISNVIGCLSGSAWFATYREFICQKYSFARTFANGTWAWRRFDSGTDRLGFPDYPDLNTESILSALLGSGSLDRVVLVKNSSFLAPSDLEPNWDESDLEWMCTAIKQEVLRNHPNARKYLAKLLSGLGALATANPMIWEHLTIYEVETTTGENSIVSTKTLQAHSQSQLLLSGGNSALKELFRDACPRASAWFAVGSVPPGVTVTAFDVSTVAKMVLSQINLGEPQNRRALIGALLAGVDKPNIKNAIRYLIHGNADKRTFNEKLFLKPFSNRQGDEWTDVIKAVLDHMSESWRLVFADYSAIINDQQKAALDVKMCDADSFRSICIGAGEVVGSLNLHPFHDFLLSHLKEGTPSDPDADNKLLRRLKIHRYGESLFTTIAESVWLAPEVGKEPANELRSIWNQLRQSAKIVERSTNDEVVLRQKQLFQKQILDPNGIILLACQQNEPHTFAKLILHHLGSIGNPTTPTATALKNAKWLPLRNGKASKLGDLLWLDGAETALRELVPHRQPDSTVVTRAEIQLELGAKETTAAWNTIRAHLIAKDETALELLRKAFAHNPNLHFGLSKDSIAPALGEWLKAVDGCEADISPAVKLVRDLWPTNNKEEAVGEQTLALGIARIFAKEWNGVTATRYDTVLEALRDKHRQGSSDTQSVITGVFYSYLSAAVRAGRWESSYRADADFTLLNQQMRWTPVSQLVIPIAGIDRRALADERAVIAIGFSDNAEADDALPGAVTMQALSDESLAALLRSYGTALSEQLPAKLWGMFVALLGETPALRTLADELTDGRTETIRDELCGAVSSGINPRRRVVHSRYTCEVTDGDTAEVVALNGDYFDAPLDMNNASFLVAQSEANQSQWWLNRFFVNPKRDGVHFVFRLCDPASFSEANNAQMLDRLERTVTQLLSEVLHVTTDRIGKVRPLIEKLMGLGQLSLGRAQHLILANAQIHLKQLGIRLESGTPLALAMEKLDEATRLEAQAQEEREHEIGDADSNENAAKKSREQGRDKLRQTLQYDSEVHRLLSDAMKKRIESEQYVPESIPFELFQNADDAFAQLVDKQEAPRIFVMEIDSAALRFAHWGRPINHPDEVSGELKISYEHDLFKMLILHGSDKQVIDAAAAVTGKFGLGFKSVYLITDNPMVISGDLAFDVAGAIYPRRLERELNDRLRDTLKNLMPTPKIGTLIELPTRVATKSLVQRFAALVPYLVIFAREIREVRLRGELERTHLWRPERVHADNRWELWMGDAGSAGRLMQLKCGDVSWLFGMDQDGIRRLSDLPCIWATAPLHSTGEVGFAINGPFDPDPGRTELGKGEAAKSQNAALFRDASEGLRQFLIWCVEREDLCGTLGLTNDATDSFWESLWNLFSVLPSSENDSSARSRVAKSAWPQTGGGGYGGAAHSFPIIPNGLPGNLAMRTSFSQVRFQTSCFLESQQGRQLLESLAEWPEWAEMEAELNVSAANVVASAVAAVLKRQVSEFELEVIQLPFVIRRLVGRAGRVTAELSRRLGEFLMPTIWSSGYNWPRREKEELEQFVADLSFESDSGEWLIPKSLLIVHGTGVESVRAAFAPPARQLNSNYVSNSALAFFRLCRGEMNVSADEMADWIKDALDRQSRERITASLRFLASTSDDLTSRTAGLLSLETRRDLMARPEFDELSQEDQHRVNSAFKIADIARDRLVGIPPLDVFPTPIYTPVSVPPFTLEDVLDFWRGHEDDAVRQFTVSGIYRDLVFPNVAEDVELGSLFSEADSIKSKEIWYRLLCLGCCMSIPLGPDPSTRILPFWRARLKDEFWAATIPANLDEVSSSGYDQRLDSFFEKIIHQNFRNENASGEDAEFWRRVFYDFRKMHFYVFKNDLPGVLLQLARSNEVEGSALIHFLRSGKIPTSMQAPGFEAWSGVIGQSMSAPLLFVMRELRRLNVLPQGRFDKACFYMNSPARRVARQLEWITDQERKSYGLGNLVSISEKAFNEIRQSEHSDALLPHFDLPLQWYAHNHSI